MNFKEFEANRLKRLPPYLFTIVETFKSEAIKKGVDLIDLGMGDPDLPTPKHIVKALCDAVEQPHTHRYSRASGDVERKLKEAIAEWYFKRFKVELDPTTEVLPLIGSKEGVAHLALAFLDPDDIALVPSPAYPVHFNGAIMAGGILYNLPLSEEKGYLPEYEKIEKEILDKSKLLFISYPNNPTGAVADLDFFEKTVAFARKNNILICHDAAYSEIAFDGYVAPSFLQVKGAKDVGIEFHTLSKTYNMAGWRIGFAVGNKDVISVLAKTKSYIDFGIFRGIQMAAIAALTGPQDVVDELKGIYNRRRDIFIDALAEYGWQLKKPQATFYIWGKVPERFRHLSSLNFVKLLIEKTGVAIAPGTGFGEYGEGYIRFALVAPEDVLVEAAKRIGQFLANE